MATIFNTAIKQGINRSVTMAFVQKGDRGNRKYNGGYHIVLSGIIETDAVILAFTTALEENYYLATLDRQ